MTLLEAAKLVSGDEIKRGVIELFAQNSEILRVLPFMNIQGNALKYNVEEALPGVGFRGINEGYENSVGILNPQTEGLVIAGGDLDVDKAIVDMQGAEVRTAHEALKIKALAQLFTLKFIKGDNETDAREISGLQARIQGDQLLSAGNASGGAALSLETLDELIDQVDNPTHLIMNKTMRRRLTQAARDPNVSGYLTYGRDEFGRQIAMYNDLPILIADNIKSGESILNFDEASATGPATSTSIYCVNMGDEGVMGLQNGGIQARDLGELEGKPLFRTRVDWYCGMAIFQGRSAARLQHIANAAITS